MSLGILWKPMMASWIMADATSRYRRQLVALDEPDVVGGNRAEHLGK